MPPAGDVAVGVVTTPLPPAGSKRPSRVLRVANARRLPRGAVVYAAPAPDCSSTTRGRRLTVLVVVTRRRPDGAGAGNAVLAARGRGAAVRRCGSYPLRSRFADRVIPRIRCDRLTALPPRAPQLMGSDATCVGALQRRLALPSPYQLPLNLDLGTLLAAGPPAARNLTATAAFVSEPRAGAFRYAIAVDNKTPRPYPGVQSDPLDQRPDTLTFAAHGGEESPNVVGGPQELAGFACRTEVAPGLPGSLTCRAPRGGPPLPPRLDFELDFDNRLPVGANAGIQVTLPRYEGARTTYDIDVTR
ncbi:MAG TPA: hypothetical protein VHF89_12745 [Solirubrobacteraceae bacterium]|nr:hypothetical protein [Solirubrobacteraceae bacterium]